MTLNNQVAVITGTSSGLGLSIAKKLTTLGVQIAVIDIAENSSEFLLKNDN